MTECATPIPLASVVDYWLGEHPETDELEEHLMACAACSARLERLATIAEGVRRLVRGGRLPLILTSALLARLQTEGVRIRQHRADPGGRTVCTAGPDDDLVTMCLSGDFRAGERIDVVIADPPELAGRLEDVPVDREAGQIILALPGTAIRPLPAHLGTIRVLAVGDEGDRAIGEYTLDHRPWAPGRG
jgi:hypothetical protein